MAVLWFIIAVICIGYVAAMFRALWLLDGKPTPRFKIPLAHLIDEPEEAAIVFFLLGILTAISGYLFIHGIGTLTNCFWQMKKSTFGR